MGMFITPKVDHVKADVVRPLTNKERARLRKEAGGDATSSQLDSLAAKFSPSFGPRVREKKLATVVELFTFDDDPDDDPATPIAMKVAA